MISLLLQSALCRDFSWLCIRMTFAVSSGSLDERRRSNPEDRWHPPRSQGGPICPSPCRADHFWMCTALHDFCTHETRRTVVQLAREDSRQCHRKPRFVWIRWIGFKLLTYAVGAINLISNYICFLNVMFCDNFSSFLPIYWFIFYLCLSYCIIHFIVRIFKRKWWSSRCLCTSWDLVIKKIILF